MGTKVKGRLVVHLCDRYAGRVQWRRQIYREGVIHEIRSQGRKGARSKVQMHRLVLSDSSGDEEKQVRI